MPRTLQEILDHADQLGPASPSTSRPTFTLRPGLQAIREAATQRATTDRHIADAVAAAHDAGVSWSPTD